MNVSLYQAAAALGATTRWQELISENINASAIPGFKKNELSFSAIFAGVMSAGSTYPLYEPTLLPKAKSYINFQNGELTYTGVSTDVAIDGPGFFELLTADGNKVYTRSGDFKISPKGTLLNKNGWEVVGTNGPIQLDPGNNAPITISSTGIINQGEITKGQIKVVDFTKPETLSCIGGKYFIVTKSTPPPQILADPNIKQGFLESSNVSPITEMGQLIIAMRFYEATQQLIKIQDERIGKTISELSGT